MACSQQRAGSKSIRSTNHMDAFHCEDCNPKLPDTCHCILLQTLSIMLDVMLVTPGANRHARNI